MPSMRWTWVAGHSDDLFANFVGSTTESFFFPLALFCTGRYDIQQS